MILGYLHIYGAEEGEVKGHIGVKKSGGIYHFWLKKLQEKSQRGIKVRSCTYIAIMH